MHTVIDLRVSLVIPLMYSSPLVCLYNSLHEGELKYLYFWSNWLFGLHYLTFLLFANSNLALQYIFRAFFQTFHVSLLSFFDHLHLLAGRFVLLPIVAPHIMVSPAMLVISEINLDCRYNIRVFNNFSCWMDDVHVWMSSIIYLSFTLWGCLMFVDRSFNIFF